MKAFFKSFKFAFSGLFYAIKSERNMKFHLLAAFVALLMSFFFKLQVFEWLFVLSAIVLVIAAELFNTSIERICDLYTKENHPLIKIAKDTAAAAVLLCALYAILVAVFIFAKYLRVFFGF